ncbi:ATP-grasp domain-containing protein [Telmatocola sphagniphila]|uniref:ATP-grasp domain-containing protein n=1 Tax=Telmatocola sphagniphila TaxID=1123043 RepID=A0A8E6B6M1_9BACT|nr:ATP-grasp domain-containing protein [Telmatocola sphagniphila]QVL31370.1 ATP-grasp domain-containing protein [Telmatocola sphagniphila]
MAKIFVYEHFCALANPPQTETLPQSLLTEGRAMRDAIVEDLARIPGIAILSGDSSDADDIREQVKRADWSLIIAPETDGILFRLSELVESSGGRLLSPSLQAIFLCGGKDKLARRIDPDIPTPDERPDVYPQVWKPYDGAGSVDTFLVPDAQAAQLLIDRGYGELYRTEFVPGLAASISFLVGPEIILPLKACRQILSEDGRFQYLGGEVPLETNLEQRAIQLGIKAIRWLLAEAPFVGYIGIDLILGERDVLIEINPRLTTSYIGLRQLTESNLAEAMWKIAEGKATEVKWKPGRVRFQSNGQFEIS